MPTFEGIPDVAVISTASVMGGLAIGIGAYLLGRNVREKAARTTRGLGETQRRIRRESAGRESGLYGLILSVLPAFVMLARGLPMESVRESLAERYARAGWPGGLDDEEIAAVALLVGLIAAALLTLVLMVVLPLAAPLGLVGLIAGPGLVSGSLTRRAARRDLEIGRTMPFVLDLLVLTMRAGAPFNTAMERVAIDYARHPIGFEFKSVLADMEMGTTRETALQDFAERNPIPAVRTFTDDLIQAEELGRPVADTLQRLSDHSRERRIQEANEMAGKAKVMVLVPGMLVFFAALILLFAPFAVKYFYGDYGGI